MREGAGSARLGFTLLQGLLSEPVTIGIHTVNIDAEGNLQDILCTERLSGCLLFSS